jgi:hypothetical protein
VKSQQNCATPPHLNPSEAQATASVQITRKKAKDRFVTFEEFVIYVDKQSVHSQRKSSMFILHSTDKKKQKTKHKTIKKKQQTNKQTMQHVRLKAFLLKQKSIGVTV